MSSSNSSKVRSKAARPSQHQSTASSSVATNVNSSKRKRLNALLDKIKTTNNLRTSNNKITGDGDNDEDFDDEDETNGNKEEDEDEEDSLIGGPNDDGITSVAAAAASEDDNSNVIESRRRRRRCSLPRRAKNKMFNSSSGGGGFNDPPPAHSSSSSASGVVAEDRTTTFVRKMSSAALRRQEWRENQQQTQTQSVEEKNDIFKFDSFDRDRYLSGGSSGGGGGREDASFASGGQNVVAAAASQQQQQQLHLQQQQHQQQQHQIPPQSQVLSTATSSSVNPGIVTSLSADDPNDPELVSPISGRSPHSSLSSPQVSVDSPRICFSPLRIKDSIEEEQEAAAAAAAGLALLHTLPKLSVRGCDSEGSVDSGEVPPQSASSSNWLSASGDGQHLHYPQQNKLLPGVGGGGYPGAKSLSRPISPNPSITPTTPISPSTPLRHLPIYLAEIYRRRCLSDTDLSSSWEELQQAKNTRGGPQGASGAGGGGGGGTSVAIPSSSASMAAAAAAAARSREPRLARSPALGTTRYLSLPSKGGSLESETSSSTTQESPLDLSVRNSAVGVVVGGGASSVGGQQASSYSRLKATVGGSMDSVVHLR